MAYIIKDDAVKYVKDNRKKGITNREIAKKIGVTEGYVSQIIHKRIVKVKLTAFAMAKAINSEFEIADIFDVF